MTPRRRNLSLISAPPWLVLLLLCAALPGAARGAAPQAEFSIRWDPARGGPASPEAVLDALGRKPGKRSHFEVQYFDITRPADAPAGFDAILRKRSHGRTVQLTFKLRGGTPWPEPSSLQQWHCPLPAPNDRKEEADIAFLGAEQTHKAWSRSCSHDSRQPDIALPAALQAQPNSCRSTMTRLKSGDLKVEAWQLPDGSRLIEASRAGRDTPADHDAFRDQVVRPLLARQVLPLQRSKSALGGECG
jgi:hypothetical protein